MSEDKMLRPRDPGPFPHYFQGGPHRANFRILIVEDDPTTQMLLRVLLADHCDITIAPTAPEALKAIRASRVKVTTNGEPAALSPSFDAIIVDINLDGPVPGLTLLSQLQDQKALRETPLVALTAHALPEKRKRSLTGELAAYRGKPFTPSELFSLLMQMMD